MGDSVVVYTVGHSTRQIEEFEELLAAYRIACLMDVRTVPKSRHNPQFNTDVLSSFLAGKGIVYRHLKALGGLRRASVDSLNIGWRNASFRGYADYMQTPEFKNAVEELALAAAQSRTAIMCAEAVPWRCHRSLIGDALLIRGIEVIDIYTSNNAKPHVLNPMAKVDGATITYPEAD